jgi:hypothetical protein
LGKAADDIAMEAKDTWLLIAGGILGFIGSLLATFAAPPVDTAIGKLKSGFIERNKAKALASYRLVWTLKSSKTDKYLYAINHWGTLSFITATAPLAAFLGIASSIIFGGPQLPRPIAFSMGAFIALLIVGWLLMRTLRFLLAIARVENFEHYRAELLRRWPDLDLPD